MSISEMRKDTDIMKLMMKDYYVETDAQSKNVFVVLLKGPTDSPYEGGIWRVRVELPSQYPYRSPSIGFQTKIFHPNVDEASGSVCLDVINQSWSPMFDLLNVFEVFLPQLLLYPNPSDPLNSNAASIYLRDKNEFEMVVKKHVEMYASSPRVGIADPKIPDEEEPLSDLEYPCEESIFE
ncbi:uncharacterized protein LOC126304710 [Schistocerca gregaria]|uniref:uncharacterized protein LOC126304710 n=1 Tax=Schistocerca gregaria TaxID=7010 RepID=UPI00211ED2BE|nr:uncharacterized protein LOC126304710 [Schistocerca gregaria]